MTTVSDFLGFMIISVFPQPAMNGPPRNPSRRRKSRDALIASDEESGGSITSEEDVPGRPRSRGPRSATPPSVVHHPMPVDQIPRPALGKPDFWILAFIMSMRTSLFDLLLTRIVSGCGLMYINVCSPKPHTSVLSDEWPLECRSLC